MLRKIGCYFLATLIISVSGYVSLGHAQPNQSLPAIVGPQTLPDTTEFYEFFTQGPEDLKGDITGIAAGDTYWVYIFGIDATSITGPPGRQIQFNLQDFETGSSFKHLGISFSLNNISAGGSDLLQCYQSSFSGGFEGLSSHGLVPGELTTGNFDLRFMFAKENSQDGWSVTPFFRLSNGTWTAFFDSSFTSTNAFDFLGAKLVVRFDAGAQGTISFDNFFVIGPPTGPISETFVDGDWAGLADGDAVQFPGPDSSIQIIGFNAFATIQEAIDAFQMLLTTSTLTLKSVIEPGFGGTVNIAPGLYNENIAIYYCVTLNGAGSGTDESVDTIVQSDAIDTPVIYIDGSMASGLSQGDRLEIRNLRVTGAFGASLWTSGILITDGGDYVLDGVGLNGTNQKTSVVDNGFVTTGFITFENVAAVDNLGSGIEFEHSGMVHDIEVTNCILSNNGDSGLRISYFSASFDSLMMTGCQIDSNGFSGLTNAPLGPTVIMGSVKTIETTRLSSVPNGLEGLTNIRINGTSFSGNGKAFTYGSGDISLFDFNGDASFTNVSIVGDSAHFGLQIHGYQGNGGLMPSGMVSFNNVSISGTYQFLEVNGVNLNSTYQNSVMSVGAGLYISNYSGVDGISFNNVQIDVSAPDNSAANLYLYDIDGTLNIGNTTFGGSAADDIRNLAPVNITATTATFSGALNNFEIEDRVVHKIDLEEIIGEPTDQAGIGLVTWVPSNLYLTPDSFFEPFTDVPSIQRAINAAFAADTLNIAMGTFEGGPQILVEKDLTMIGSGKDTTIAKPTADTGNSDDERGWFLVGPEVVLHVRDMTFDGTGNKIYQAFRHHGEGTFTNVGFREIKFNESGPDYAGVAVAALGNGPVNVTNCAFTQIGRTGVSYTGSGVNGSVFSGNTYTGKGEGSFLDYALDISGGAEVQVIGCTISNNQGFVNTDSVSAGILITTLSGNGTTVNINENEIFNCTSAIQIGVDTTDGSFVMINQNELHGNDTGVLASSALFIRLDGNQIYMNNNGVDLNSVTVFDIDNNEIYDNENDGVKIKDSFGEIDNNIIHNNTGNGLTIFDEASTGTTVNHNEFCINGGFAIENQVPASIVDATGNWWGASDGPSGVGPGSGDAVSAGVDFSPFETGGIFADSPCAQPVLLLETKMFLEGPYNSATGEMSTALNDGGNIPLTSPYSEDPRSVAIIPDDIVDWVLVELREPVINGFDMMATNGAGNSVTVASKSAFLHKDGRIVADDGTSGQISLTLIRVSPTTLLKNVAGYKDAQAIVSAKFIRLDATHIHDKKQIKDNKSMMNLKNTQIEGQEYFIVIRHRNHLAVMSANPLALSAESPTLYDFTTNVNKFFSADAKELGPGVYGMYAGDANGNGQVQNDDKNDLWRAQAGTAGYKAADFNLNGQVQNDDKNVYWRMNVGRGTQVPLDTPSP